MTAVSAEFILQGLLPADPEPAVICAEAGRDDQLAVLAARGDKESFGKLVRRHEGPLYAMCVHLTGNGEEARDAAQESFIRAWHALRHYEPRGKFRAWLWCIAVNLCRDRLRRTRRRQQFLSSWEECCTETPADGSRSPDEITHWRAEMEKLSRGLEAMPEKLRWPLMLCAVEGLPQVECGIVLGISARAVEGKVRRARQWLLDWWKAHP